MAMPHGTVKSGQTRNVNMRGATNKMVAFVSKHRANSKPVSINYLRGLVKQYNLQIDKTDDNNMPVHDSATIMRLTLKREKTYTAIKMFQAAYAAGDTSALKARMYCRLNDVQIPGDNAVTMRETGNAVQRIAEMLGDGGFDTAGIHFVSKEGKPRIPGGYAKGDDAEFGRELTPEESAFWKRKREPAPFDPEAPARLKDFLTRNVRVDRRKEPAGVNKTASGEVIPNPPRFKDTERLGDGFKAGKIVSTPATTKAIKVSFHEVDGKPVGVVSGSGGAAEFISASNVLSHKANIETSPKKRIALIDKALVLAHHAKYMLQNGSNVSGNIVGHAYIGKAPVDHA